MIPAEKLKLGLVLAALILFGAGARFDVHWLRWAAVALLVLAFTLRFTRRR
jgi:hypothetical protein